MFVLRGPSVLIHGASKFCWFHFQSTLLKQGVVTPEQFETLAEALRNLHPPIRASFDPSLPEWLVSLVMQAWHLINYDWQKVVNFDATFRAKRSAFVPASVAVEQEFITLVARSHLGGDGFESAYQAQLAHVVQRSDLDDVAFGFVVEKAAIAMSQGFYREALRILDDAGAILSQRKIVGSYWHLRYEIVLGICRESLGLFKESALNLANQKSILKRVPQPLLWMAYARRQLSHYIESEQFTQADDFRALIENSVSNLENPVLKAMYLSECVRLHLEFGRVSETQRCFVAFETLVRESNIPRSFLLNSHHHCELALLTSNPQTAARFIIAELWEIQKTGSPDTQAMALFALSRAHAHAGNFDAALQNAEMALYFSEKQSFGRTTVRILVLLFSLAIRSGEIKNAEFNLQRLAVALEKIDLPLHRDLVLSLVWRYSGRSMVWKSAVGSFRNFAEHGVVVAWRNYYLLDSSEPSLFSVLEKLRRGLVGFDSETQTLLTWREGEGLCVEDLSGDTAMTKLALHFLRRPAQGFAIEEIHHLFWKGVEYRSQRHGARLHSLIKMVRQLLGRCGLRIEFKDSRYYLNSSHSLFVLGKFASKKVKTRKKRALTKYRDRILRLLEHRSCSGAQIAAHLKLQRHSLHPLLKEMERMKLILFVKQGRYSLYSVFPVRSGSKSEL